MRSVRATPQNPLSGLKLVLHGGWTKQNVNKREMRKWIWFEILFGPPRLGWQWAWCLLSYRWFAGMERSCTKEKSNAMEWVCNVGYEMFPWVSGAAATEPQNVMHFIVTILIVALSLAALILTESSKSPASIAQSNKQRVRTCLYQIIWSDLTFVATWIYLYTKVWKEQW